MVKPLLPACSGRRRPFHENSPVMPAGSTTAAVSLAPARSNFTSMEPLGCGTEPDTLVNSPRNGRTSTRPKPGAAESTPSTVWSSS